MSDIILFHHPKSQACQKLFKLIPKDTKIKYINIETLQSIPSSVKSVPCLIVDGNNSYLGKDVFNYFSSSNEIEYINLCGKNGSKCTFSIIGDDSIESNGNYSSINEISMSQGIPQYEEKKQDQTMDIDKLTA